MLKKIFTTPYGIVHEDCSSYKISRKSFFECHLNLRFFCPIITKRWVLRLTIFAKKNRSGSSCNEDPKRLGQPNNSTHWSFIWCISPRSKFPWFQSILIFHCALHFRRPRVCSSCIRAPSSIHNLWGRPEAGIRRSVQRKYGSGDGYWRNEWDWKTSKSWKGSRRKCWRKCERPYCWNFVSYFLFFLICCYKLT